MADNTEVDIDNLLGTGVGANITPPATPEPTPEEQAATKKASQDAAAAGNTPSTEEVELTPQQIAEINEENSSNLKTLLTSFIDESSLDDDNKGIRADLLSKHKGTSFDADGNILDSNGKQVASFQDILEDSLSEEELTLDKDGNQVNAEGTIVKTKLELAIENTVVNQWHAEGDYEFRDEDGNVKIYEDTPEGGKEYAMDVATQMNAEWKSEFFNQNPELAEIAKHILSGGNVANFQTATDYSQLDVKTMSDNDKENYVRKSLAGLDESRIDSIVQLIKDSNTLDLETAKAIPILQSMEEKAAKGRDEAYAKSIAERNEKVDKYWGTVEQTINQGKLLDITIPDTDKEGFFDYLSTAVDNKGNSKEMLDSQKETLEQQLQLKYLRYKGYDYSKLVDTKVKQHKVESLKERMRRSAKIKSTPINDATKGQTSGGKDITIDSLLS